MSNDTPRRMPTLTAVADYWRAEGRADIFPELISHFIGWGEPFCFRCGWLVPEPPEAPDGMKVWRSATGWLERAHLHERFSGGFDAPENLVPLCNLCHRQMPQLIRHRDDAITWINGRCADRTNPWWQIATDDRWGGENFTRFPGRSVFYGFRLHVDAVVRERLASIEHLAA